MSAQKVAVVTGAGTGIGRAVALALMKVGFGVALAGRRQDKLDETASAGVKTNGQSLVVPTDVSDPGSIKALFAKTKEAFGRVDLLFNNAGTNAGIPIEDLPLEKWQAVVATNITALTITSDSVKAIRKTSGPAHAACAWTQTVNGPVSGSNSDSIRSP